jgi:hypothetical protein
LQQKWSVVLRYPKNIYVLLADMLPSAQQIRVATDRDSIRQYIVRNHPADTSFVPVAIMLLSVLLSFVLLLPLSLSLSIPASREIPNAYIITLHPASSASTDSHLAWLSSHMSSIKASSSTVIPKITHKYDLGSFSGYAGTFSPAILTAIAARPEVNKISHPHPPLSNTPQVASITPDGFAPTSTRCAASPLPQPESAGLWGFGRISHRTRYPSTTLSDPLGWPTYDFGHSLPHAKTVYAYIIDSGLNTLHPELINNSYNAYLSNPEWPSYDVCGHGTFVASILLRLLKTVGAKVKVIGVKVLEGEEGFCSGAWSDVIAGVNYAVREINASPSKKGNSVVNISMAGRPNAPMDLAVEEAVKMNVTVVVSAGNSDGANSCLFSPARAPGALTVGGTTVNDQVAEFSNLGRCVNLFAPGENIRGAWWEGGYRIMSGTSMSWVSPSPLGLH